MGRISLVVPLLNAVVLANNLCQDSDDAALITLNSSMKPLLGVVIKLNFLSSLRHIADHKERIV